MAKLFNFLFILSFGIICFPNPICPAAPLYEEPIHRFSCLGVEHDLSLSNGKTDAYGGFRRTIGSGLFFKSNPEMWKYYDLWDYPERHGHWYHAEPQAGVPMEVKLYWIKVDGRFLNGWLHVVVKSTGPEAFPFGILQIHGVVDYTTITYNDAEDDLHDLEAGRGGFGEFVPDFPSCTDDDHKDDPKPNKYQYMPCGGLPEREQTMPWGFQYVEPTVPEFDYIVPSGEQTEFHMNFRFSTQPCNHPKIIRLAAIAYFPDGDPNDAVFKNRRWRYGVSDELQLTDEHVVGAADPVPRPGTYTTLDCSERISTSSAPKYVNVKGDIGVKLIRPNRGFSPACTEAATINFFSIGYSGYKFGETNLFGGRCEYGIQDLDSWKADRASTTRINQCNSKNVDIKDPSTGKTAVEYNNHVENNIAKNLESHCAPCPPTLPPRPVTSPRTRPTLTPDPSQPNSLPENLMTEDLVILRRGIDMTNSKALDVWDTRILHGVCMTILTIFVSPINVFITRYFKETFLDTQILFLRMWYFVHHTAIAASAILYGAGLWRIVNRRAVAGVSLAQSGTLHRSLGWVSIGIMILLVVFGGFRPIRRKLRTYVIAAHWTFGMIIYFTNYALMIISVWIPASPSAWVDGFDDESFPIKMLIVPFLIILWILFDIVMHVVITIHVCNMDKRLKLSRPRYWVPVPISVLPSDETRDMIGSSYRKKMLVVYGVVSLLVTMVICIMLLTSDPKSRGLGFMSCTHNGRSDNWQSIGKARC